MDRDKREVFLVVTAAPIGGSEWLVKGRAYDDVRIGDVVRVDAGATQNQDERHTYRVEAIRTYGHEVPELNCMMTGELILHGQHGEIIRKDTILYAA